MSPVILAVLVAYGVLLFAIGLATRRGSATVAGYYVADKRLPAWVIAFSNNATGESAWLLLGLTGMGYAVGFHALWVALGEVLGVALGWTLVAPRFKTATDRFDSITVPDYLTSRFRDTRHRFRWIGFVVIVTMVTAYTAAQLTAMGKAFDAFLGTSYTSGTIIGLLFILFYTTVGGFKAVAWSDLVQGLLMFAGLLVMPFVGFAAAGGWTAVIESLRAQDPALLTAMGEAGLTLPGIISALGFIAVGLAFLGAPQLLVRWISARDLRQIRSGGTIAVLCMIVFDLGAIFTGIAGRALLPGLADAETILPRMTSELLPVLFVGIYLVIVLAASMSTVDSLLILVSSSVARDIVQHIFGPALTELRIARLGQAVTLMIGIGALAFALGEVRVIFWFVLFAWSGLACAFTPVVLCALFWRRTTRQGAVTGMIAGFVTAIVWVIAFKSRTYGLYEMIPGFMAGILTTVLVSLGTEPDPDALREFDEVVALESRQRPEGRPSHGLAQPT
ncbi:MAG: sodium/proline symporter [Gemmatimonadetes bacterium]|nr:sodium/proline symporter [Gemmatimonadota bacterium]